MQSNVHYICWLTISFATVSVSLLGIFLRIVWHRLSVCLDSKDDMLRKLNEVETKLLMLETWKLQQEQRAASLSLNKQ